jgi:hypothetical protein
VPGTLNEAKACVLVVHVTVCRWLRLYLGIKENTLETREKHLTDISIFQVLLRGKKKDYKELCLLDKRTTLQGYPNDLPTGSHSPSHFKCTVIQKVREIFYKCGRCLSPTDGIRPNSVSKSILT